MAYIVIDPSSAGHFCDTVVAPPGWYFSKHLNGIVRDSATKNGGPEWGSRKNAFRFRSHRAAARIKNLCGPGATIIEVAGKPSKYSRRGRPF